MAIQYSGGTLENVTFSPTTRQHIVDNITTTLQTAGWTAISGTPGSGADVTMESAATAAGAKIRFRFLEPGSGNCAQVTMKHSSGSPTSQIAYCLPSNTWRIVANQYQFFAFMTGASNAGAARSQVIGGVLYTPSFISVSSGDAVAWMQTVGASDADATTTRLTFRRQLRSQSSGNVSCVWSGMFGSTLVESTAATVGGISIVVLQGGNVSGDSHYRWEDTTLLLYEPLVGWATGSATGNEGRIKGQLWDAMVVSGVWTSETVVSFDGHTWIAITDSANTVSNETQTLFIAIT